jgi:hypothetical protein
LPRPLASISSRILRIMNSASDSALFSTTLPTNPSQTMTSIEPSNRSRPSTLPAKLSPATLSSFNASRVSSEPLLSSSPIDIRPIRGEGVPITSWA